MEAQRLAKLHGENFWALVPSLNEKEHLLLKLVLVEPANGIWVESSKHIEAVLKIENTRFIFLPFTSILNIVRADYPSPSEKSFGLVT